MKITLCSIMLKKLCRKKNSLYTIQEWIAIVYFGKHFDGFLEFLSLYFGWLTIQRNLTRIHQHHLESGFLNFVINLV